MATHAAVVPYVHIEAALSLDHRGTFRRGGGGGDGGDGALWTCGYFLFLVYELLYLCHDDLSSNPSRFVVYRKAIAAKDGVWTGV